MLLYLMYVAEKTTYDERILSKEGNVVTTYCHYETV